MLLYLLNMTRTAAVQNWCAPIALIADSCIFRRKLGTDTNSPHTGGPIEESTLTWQAAIIDYLPQGIILIGTDGRMLYQNPTARELFGINDSDLVDDTLLAQILLLSPQDLTDITNSTGSQHVERKRSLGGQERLFQYDIIPVEVALQKCRLITATDRTEMMISLHQAESSCQAKSQFLANITHEIRTPMIGVLGAVDLLEQSPLSERQLDNLNIIRECSEQLLTIINGILDVSKIEVGMVDLHPTSCGIRPLLSRCLKTVEPLLQAKGLKLQMQVDEQLPEIINLDQSKMQQIIANILSNAVKFTHRGSVSIKAYASEEAGAPRLIIAISDTGIGINPEELTQIFAPFTQVDSSTTRQYGGTGLGLYICHKLASLMGGTIWAESQFGVGTTMYVQVPLLEAAPSTAEMPYPQIFPSKVDNNVLGFEAPRVLLTEDNLLNQKIVAQMLHNYGFYYRVCGNGLECLDALHQEPFSVVLLDMQMPIMDGYETAAIIRQDPSLSHLAIIAMTANSMVGDREKCLASGCSDYISKPFKARELADLITHHLPAQSRDTALQNDTLIINELMPELLEMMGEMLESVYACWQKKDLAGLQSLGHDMKGTVGMYGLTAISQLAGQLERAAREHNYSEAAMLIGELEEKYGQIRVQFLGNTATNRAVF